MGDPELIPDDEIDIALRSAEAVGRRMIALSAVAHRVGVQPNEEPDDEDDDPSGLTDEVEERLDWLAWLADHSLLDALTAAERALLDTGDESLGDDDRDDQATALESLGALAWAVNRSGLTVLDRGYPYQRLLDGVPSPWQEPRPFLDVLTVRAEAEIATARDAAELLSWRAQVEVERRAAGPREAAEIEDAIRDVAKELVEAGLAPVGPDGDLLIGGEPIRSLDDGIVVSMAAAARARLRAISWLCGLGDWDDPALVEI